MLSFNKKILVVSSWAPPMQGGSPQVFGNLFSEFNPDSYVIFTDFIKNARTYEGRQKLPCRYYFFNNGRNHFLNPESRFKIVRIATKFFFFFSAIRQGLRIIRSEKIDILMGTSDKGPALILTFILSKFSEKPYVLYLLDLYRWNNLGAAWNKMAIFFEPVFFKKAKKIFIGEGHRRFYQKKYGNKYSYEVVLNCAEKNNKKNEENLLTFKTSPYTILFTGNIYWAQERSLRNLIRAISEIKDADIRFVICSEKTNLSSEEFKQNPQIIFTSLTPKKIPDALKNADILFLPLSWNTPSPEVIEMAVPGKTAEYLASGTPILVHAPADCYLSKYAKERGFAHVVDTEDILALQNGIRKILTDKEYSKNLVVNAQKASHDYDVRKNALVLKNAMDTI